jgi:hypothetical protein
VSNEEGSAIGWDLPPWETTYPTPFVQQSTYEFSVRVPAGPVSTAEYMNGFFTVKYRHQDMDQNFYASVISADGTNPTVTITKPLAGTIFNRGSKTVSATATDNVGVVGVQFKLNGADLNAEDTTEPFSIYWDTTKLYSGSYILSAMARDALGNTTLSSDVPVKVNACPTCNLTAGKVGTTYTKTLIEAVWIVGAKPTAGTIPPGMYTIEDMFDGISNTRLRLGGKPTKAGIYSFTLQVRFSKIGGGSVNYWYPSYQIEIKP